MRIFLLLHILEHITTTGIYILNIISIYSTFVGSRASANVALPFSASTMTFMPVVPN